MSILYLVTNKKNGKQYVGQTKGSLSRRKSQHYSKARCNQDYNHPFLNALRKYEQEDFIWIELDIIDDLSIDKSEKEYIKNLNTTVPNGYNLQSGGCNNTTHSTETRLKLIKSKIGKKNPMYGKSAWNKGKKLSKTHKENMMRARTGRKLSAQHKQNISKAMLGNSNRWGKQGESKPDTD